MKGLFFILCVSVGLGHYLALADDEEEKPRSRSHKEPMSGQLLVEGDSISVQRPTMNAAQRERLQSMDVQDLITSELEAAWKREKLTPSAQASPRVWIRRAFLDMIGRPPTVSELEEAQEEGPEGVCEKLADSDEWADYWAQRYSKFGMATHEDQRASYFIDPTKLAEALKKKNARWDNVVYGVASAFETKTQFPNQDKAIEANAKRAAETMTQLFLGLRIQCAQCHNQPNLSNGIEDVSAAMKKTGLTAEEAKIVHGRVKKSSYQGIRGLFRDLDPGLVDQAGDRYGKLVSSQPEFLGRGRNSRKQLVDLETGEVLDSRTHTGPQAAGKFMVNHELFSIAFVNRIWGNFFGHGLNSSDLDDLNENDTSRFRVLLEELARRFREEANYSPREFMKWICMSYPYSLGFRVPKKLRGTGYLEDDSPEMLEKREKEATSFAYKPHIPAARETYARQLAMLIGADAKGNTKVQPTPIVSGGQSFPQPIRDDSYTAFLSLLSGAQSSFGEFRAEGYKENLGRPASFTKSLPDSLDLFNSPVMLDQLNKSPVLDMPLSMDGKIRQAYLRGLSREPSEKESLFYIQLSWDHRLSDIVKSIRGVREPRTPEEPRTPQNSLTGVENALITVAAGGDPEWAFGVRGLDLGRYAKRIEILQDKPSEEAALGAILGQSLVNTTYGQRYSNLRPQIAQNLATDLGRRLSAEETQRFNQAPIWLTRTQMMEWVLNRELSREEYRKMSKVDTTERDVVRDAMWAIGNSTEFLVH